MGDRPVVPGSAAGRVGSSAGRRAVLLDITCDSDGAIDHYTMVMVLPRQCQCRSTIQRIRDARFLHGRRISGDPRQYAQPFGDTEAVDVFVFPDGSVEVDCLTKAIPWRTCCNMYSSIRNAVNPVPRSSEENRS